MELISRDEAKRKIIEELDSIDHVPGWVFRRLERVISSLPTIEERKEGKWLHAEIIDDDKDLGVNSDATQCSICGDYQESYYWAKTYYHYCPNCGARMKGE